MNGAEMFENPEFKIKLKELEVVTEGGTKYTLAIVVVTAIIAIVAWVTLLPH
jgi:hypothetical protein